MTIDQLMYTDLNNLTKINNYTILFTNPVIYLIIHNNNVYTIYINKYKYVCTQWMVNWQWYKSV